MKNINLEEIVFHDIAVKALSIDFIDRAMLFEIYTEKIDETVFLFLRIAHHAE